MNTSFSQSSQYIMCPKSWWWNYDQKLESPDTGASLYFGSAIDHSVMEMLKGNKDWLIEFYDRWNKAFSFGKVTKIFDNPNVLYAHKDFDIDVLEDKDILTCETWAKQLNLIQASVTLNRNDVASLHGTISKKKKNPYLTVSADEMALFSRLSWLSMKRKGKLLLQAFNTQFLPKVKKVVATQERAAITDPNTGDSIVGFVDMILEIEGYDKPIIFDLKTAGQPYKQEEIELTQQLTLYAAMKGQTIGTDLVGYIVLCKNIPKDEVGICKSCGNVKNSGHKTCNVLINNKRCGGEWDIKSVPNPQVQVLIERKTPNQINDLLLDYGSIILGMKNNIVYKNTSKCNNFYGGKCAYYNACHHGDTSGLKKKGT